MELPAEQEQLARRQCVLCSIRLDSTCELADIARPAPSTLLQRIPTRIIEKAVWGMLPKGRLGNRIKLHLKVFKGDAHPHIAQKPVDITHLIDTKPEAGAYL
jgi:ribosomal protein L13